VETQAIYEITLWKQTSLRKGYTYIKHWPSPEEGLAIALTLLEESNECLTEILELKVELKKGKIVAMREKGDPWVYHWGWHPVCYLPEKIPRLEQHLTSKSKIIREAVKGVLEKCG